MADPTSTTYRAVAVTVKVGLTSLLGIDLDIQGTSRIPGGGKVIAHNQTSVLDAFVVSLALAEQGDHRPIIMLREDLRHIPVLGKLLSAGAVFAEDTELPGGYDNDAFTAAIQHLHQDSAVVVAPEHVVSPSLELMPLRSGAARLATATDVPLLPVATFGAHRLFDERGRFRPRRGLPVSVTFGNPVPLEGLFDYMPAMRRLQFDLEALLAQVLTDYPDREEGEAGAPWWPRARGGTAPSLLDTLENAEQSAPGVELWASNDAVAEERRRHGFPTPASSEPAEIEPRQWSLDDLDDQPAVGGAGHAGTPPPMAPTAVPTMVRPAVAPTGVGTGTTRVATRPPRPQGTFVTDVIAIAAFDLPGQPKQVLRKATMNVKGPHLTTRDDFTSVRMRVRDLHRDGARTVFWGIVEDDHVVGPIGGGLTVPAGTGLMLAATRKVG